jgi:ribonucleoside-diphosphate reductase alpha chain
VVNLATNTRYCVLKKMELEKPQEIKLKNLDIERAFSKEGISPFKFDINGKPVEIISEEVNVTDDRGKTVFIQKDVKRPSFWSPLAMKVVASKYFWGDSLKNERENSIEQLVGRVSRYIGRQALAQKYFDAKKSKILEDEIAVICFNQMASFNSPVWFNAGTQEYDKNAGGVAPFKFDFETSEIVKTNKVEDRPQCSACFIQSIKDNMESILELQVSEANLFRAGSGTGTNRSPLRSSKEKLTGGGRASGPLSFMKGYDAYAGIIKSGGKTRRAAKMEILNIDHPDVIDFINAKQNEEKKAWALIEQGYNGGLNGEAYSSVAFQNCNMSVRVPDEFMTAVKINGDWNTKFVKTKEVCETFKARELLKKIAEGTHICGDPGMQFDSIINKWHTCKTSGRINASNPCVTGDTKVLTNEGRWKRIDSFLGKKVEIITNTGLIEKSQIEGSFKTGNQPVYKLTTKCGYELKLTAEHKVFTINRGFIPAYELTKEDFVLLPVSNVSEISEVNDKIFYQMLGVYLGDGCGGKGSNKSLQLTMNKFNERSIIEKFAEYTATNYERLTHKNSPASIQITPTSVKYSIVNTSLINRMSNFIDLSCLSYEKFISDEIFSLSLGEQKYILQGLFTSDGTVANYGDKSQYVSLESTSLQLIKDVQLLLLGFGIKSKIYKNRRAGKLNSLLPDGKGGIKEYKVKEIHSLRISRDSRFKFERLIGFMPESPKFEKLKKLNSEIESYQDKPIDSVESLEYLGIEEVYDLTEPITHSFIANGITIHNCSEYMFLDDSACNLTSLNLMKYRTEEGLFNVDKFKKTIKSFIIAMDLAVDGSSYPTAQIAKNSHDFRPLGMGYANLGALLMSLGMPYDSDSGRAIAAAVTAIMTGEAYKVSATLAAAFGPFKEYPKNRESMIEVIKMHRRSVAGINIEAIPEKLKYLVKEASNCWNEALELGEMYGFRNAQVCVLAPTGTIGFMMDCDTTGVEPDIALVKYKVLSGGGMLKLVNRSVSLALDCLGYSRESIEKILLYIEKNEMIEGAPELSENHLMVFDCAFKPARGKRFIEPKGHIKMMGAIQPFISGAISKTINMPEKSTIEEIAEAYIFSWEQGLKAVAIYRENSKRSQPLNTKKTEGERVKVENEFKEGSRKKLSQTRISLTHKFDIGGHEGYLTVGLYKDGKPGEVFVTMSKEGSTIRGLMDAWATSVSMNLQYGATVLDLFKKFRNQKFEPSGFVRNEADGELDIAAPPIRTASSIVDYVAQFMISRFGEDKGAVELSYKKSLTEEEKDIRHGLCDFCCEQAGAGRAGQGPEIHQPRI